MTSTPDTLRAALERLQWLSDEAPKLWWQPNPATATSKSAHLEVRAIADAAIAALQLRRIEEMRDRGELSWKGRAE